ncbi:hypothetical protein DUF512 [Thermacetogenium phaeum DSM 12270]|uniref:PDZ domain-containing protein n=1 Tax=Thermacetogenium phaeum (strain ATCC BAA-254 / DSM 26808 / PB) TaxID=1089553 RepID=K4LFG8_THEPS|nr:DUF512 domain-containing protein [Thermacetogenium phaeum]AFV11766.1 hypothetical protein DUF512 [Thermacetogenium phaeum DSM 12270]
MERYDRTGIPISGIIAGTPAASWGIKKGDYLLSVNGVRPRDLIAYRYLIAGEKLRLSFRKSNGTVTKITVAKEYDSDLGLVFENDCFDGIKRCRNRCIFCFIDQLPPGLRETLYVKDDDYRLSFLHGNFITLTNLRDQDLTRILRFKLSPLYLSVHTTNPHLRGMMLGLKRKAPVLDKIATLAAAGVNMHIQIVLCPGWNDGKELERTIGDLAAFQPQVRSIGIVPVGLTKFRGQLPSLRSPIGVECRRLIADCYSYQTAFRKRTGRSFVYLADEFYLKARLPFPPYSHYDDFPQLENGIGMARLLREEFRRLLPSLPKKLAASRRFLIATSRAGAEVIRPLVDRLNLIQRMDLRIIAIPNTFFGPHINVTGLLTGRDLLWGLRNAAGEDVLVPCSVLRQGTSLFLDGMSVSDVERETGCSLHFVEPQAAALVNFLCGKKVG